MRVERSTEYRIVVSQEELELIGLTIRRVLAFVEGSDSVRNGGLSLFNSKDLVMLRNLSNGVAGVRKD